MKKIIKTLILIMIIAPLLNGCDDRMKDDVLAAYDDLPVGLYLESRDDLSQWVQLLKYTNTYNALNVDNKYTCFVPDNNAFSKWMQQAGYAKVEDIPVKLATEMARYSVIVGNLYPNAAFGDGRIADSTATGDYLITKYREGGINSIYINDYARITEKDISVVNGIVHIVDHVLVPITETLWDVIDKTPDYSIFKQAVEKTGLDKVLEEIRVNSFKIYRSVMIVSNSVFATHNITKVEDLISLISPGNINFTDESNPLYQYIAYHIAIGNQSFSDLGTFSQNAKSKNINTLAKNELFSVDDIKSQLYINKDGDKYIQFVPGKYDIQAKNGYIHEIDNVMPVFSPKPTQVIFEFTDFPELATISYYRTWPIAMSREKLTEKTCPPQIRWKTVPEGVHDIWYETRSNWTGLLYRDALVGKLGDVGWIEIDLPQVVKGKYKISLGRNVYLQRGIFQPFFDGTRLGGSVNFSSGSLLVELGSRDFKTTDTHTIRFSVVKKGDNEANIELDYIQFDPIVD